MTTDERVSKLEAHLDELHTTASDLRSQLRQARVDQWQGRIDDLELQFHLGVVEGNDRVTQARATLRSSWDKARRQLQDTSTDAAAATQSVQDTLHGAYDDVRAAVIEAAKSVKR